MIYSPTIETNQIYSIVLSFIIECALLLYLYWLHRLQRDNKMTIMDSVVYILSQEYLRNIIECLPCEKY